MKRRVYREKLLALGFTDEEISAAEAMEKDGLYDMEPSEDLVERIMQRLEGRLKT